MIAALVTLLALMAAPLPYAVEGAPPLRKAPVTLGLLLINTFIFLATHVSAHGLVEPLTLFNTYGLTPAEITPPSLVTYMFLHISGAHVLWNMVFLYLFGTVVEERVGSVLFAALYLLGGVAAGLVDAAIIMHFAAHSSAAYLPVVGASGAISGIIGLFAVFGGKRPLKLFWTLGLFAGHGWNLLEIPAGVGVTIWLLQTLYGAAVTLLHTDAGGVAYFTHLGGFFFGMAFGYVGGLTHRGRWQGVSSTLNTQEPGGAVSSREGMLELLERSVGAEDFERAAALYVKCRTVGVAVPPAVIESLCVLAVDSGHPERAAQLRASALPPDG